MYARRSIPSMGIVGFSWNGRHVTVTRTLGPNRARAFSSRRLPTQHHGQTTSETTSKAKARGLPSASPLVTGAGEGDGSAGASSATTFSLTPGCLMLRLLAHSAGDITHSGT